MKDERINQIRDRSNELKRFWVDSPKVGGQYERNDGESNEVWITADQYFNAVDYLLEQLAKQKEESDMWELKYYRLRNEGLE